MARRSIGWNTSRTSSITRVDGSIEMRRNRRALGRIGTGRLSSVCSSSHVRLVAHLKPRPAGRGNIVHLTERGAAERNRVVQQAVHRFFFCPTEPLAHWSSAKYAAVDRESILNALDPLDRLTTAWARTKARQRERPDEEVEFRQPPCRVNPLHSDDR